MVVAVTVHPATVPAAQGHLDKAMPAAAADPITIHSVRVAAAAVLVEPAEITPRLE